MAEQLDRLLQLLRNGVAFALNTVRTEAKNQLQGPQVVELRSSVNEITAPLQELKARERDVYKLNRTSGHTYTYILHINIFT